MAKGKSDNFQYTSALGLGDRFSKQHVQVQSDLNMQKEDSDILREGMDYSYATKDKKTKRVIRMIDFNKAYLDKSPMILDELALCYRDVLGHQWARERDSNSREGGEYLRCSQCKRGLSIEDVFSNSEGKYLGELDEKSILDKYKCQHCGAELQFWHDSRTVRSMIENFLREDINSQIDEIFNSTNPEDRKKLYRYSHGVLMSERDSNKSAARVIGFAIGTVRATEKAIEELRKHVRIYTSRLHTDKTAYDMHFEEELERLRIVGAYEQMKRDLHERLLLSKDKVAKQKVVDEMEEALKKMQTSDKPEDIASMQKAIADMQAALAQTKEAPKKVEEPDLKKKALEKLDQTSFVLYMPEIVVRRDEQSTERIKVLLQRFVTSFITRLADPKINVRCHDLLRWATEKSSTYNMLIGLEGESFYEFGYGDLVAIWNDLDMILEALKKPTMQFWRDIRVRTKQRMAEILKT